MDMENIINRLNEEARPSLHKKKPNLVCNSLQKLFDYGLAAYQEKDFEQAYTMYRKWLYCVEWLQTQCLDQQTIKENFPVRKVQRVEHLLKYLIEQIKKAKRGAKTSHSSNLEIKEHHTVDNDPDIQLPDTPSDEPQPKENDEITCSELLEIMTTSNTNNKKKVLVFDLRTREDYAKTRMSFSDIIIHIPPDKIKLNCVPGYYREILLDDKEALIRFNQRSSKYTDIIVLMDKNSSLNTMEIDSAIAIFKICLEKKDVTTEYKRIAVLKGGFQEWMNTCSDYVTYNPKNKLFSLNNPSNDQNDGTVSSIKVSPILSNNKSISTINSEVKTKNVKNLSLLNHNESKANEKSSIYPSITNLDIGVYENGLNNKLLHTNNIKEVKVVIKNINQKPTVDRSNKPTLGNKLSNDKINQMSEKLKNIEIEESKIKDKPGGLDDWGLEQLETLQKEKEKLKEELNSYKNQPLYPSLNDHFSSTMALIPIKRTTHPSNTILSSEDKENVQDIQQKKVDRGKIQPVTPSKMDVDDEDTYTERIKSDNLPMNSGLKRSHSSPNITQVKKLKATHQLNVQKESRKIPQVDRSSKPTKLTANTSHNKHKSIISSAEREQRMEPVYRSYSGTHPGITGLKNLGNSCYMNSIIQCLSNTVYLAKYFNSNSYLNDLNRKNDKRYVAEEVAQVIKALWIGHYKTISPRDLKSVVGQYKLQFESYDQQDSHEFLMFLLDWMHDDLKQTSKVSYDRLLTTAEKEWEKSMDSQSSIISDLFFGQLRSTIACLYCGKNSMTYETFNSLTMSLPVSNKCTLDDCVRKFVSGQKVSGWKCPNCKVPRDGEKKFDFAKLPNIIVIHLNRFGETGGWLEKKNTAVDFPLTDFNLRPYLVQDCDSLNNSVSSSYNLYAMSNHYGTMDGGHYTAYCKNNAQKWYKYDDHTVNEVPPSQVKNQSNSAYLLFYQSASAEPYLNS